MWRKFVGLAIGAASPSDNGRISLTILLETLFNKLMLIHNWEVSRCSLIKVLLPH